MKASAEIDDVMESGAFQGAGGEVAALTVLTIDEDTAIAREFGEAVAEFAEGDVHGVLEAAALSDFAGHAHVEKEFTIGLPIVERGLGDRPGRCGGQRRARRR